MSTSFLHYCRHACCKQIIHVNMRQRESVLFIGTPSATLALKCIVNNGYQHAVSHTVTSFIQLSRNSLPSLSRRISSPSAYPRACCPTSYTTYVIYTEGYPCRLPHASPPRRTDFVGQPCLCMSHGFTGHLNSAAGPSIPPHSSPMGRRQLFYMSTCIQYCTCCLL